MVNVIKDALIELFPFSQRHDTPGAPDGIWEGQVIGEGDSGGGVVALSLSAGEGLNKGRLFIIRSAAVEGPGDAGTDKFEVRLSESYFRSTTCRIKSGVIPASGQTKGGESWNGMSWLWLPPQNADSDLNLMVMTTDNVDTEDWKFLAQGEYWELGKLRRSGIGPIVRW